MKTLDVLSISLVNLNILAGPVDAGVFERDATLADDYQVVVGGDGTNQAVVLSCLGRKTGICGKIGVDAFGKLALEMLVERGVNTDRIIRCPAEKTAVCLVLVKENGDRNFIVKRGACDRFVLEDIDFGALHDVRILNVGSLFTFKNLYGEDLAALLALAQKQGVITSADCMHDTYQLGRESMLPVLQHLDYFFPSYEEACYLTQKSDPEEMAKELLAFSVKTVVIKLGREGCLIGTQNEIIRIPAFEVRVVDTTGAGDNFIAGFLHGVLSGWTIEQCGLFATATAAISVGNMGATGAVENEQQVKRFLKQEKILNGGFQSI